MSKNNRADNLPHLKPLTSAAYSRKLKVIAFVAAIISMSFSGLHSPAVSAAAPTPLPPTVSETTLSAGGSHTCAITAEKLVRCWGDNQFGQSSTPVDLINARQVTAGYDHTCALIGSSTIKCWGDNSVQQLEVPSGLGQVKKISAGNQNTCSLSEDGSVNCWGINSLGESNVPIDLEPATDLSVGSHLTCIVGASKAVRCWGDLRNSENSVPDDLNNVESVSVGENSICSLSFSGGVRCWGSNVAPRSYMPDIGETAVEVSTGFGHSCAVISRGEVKCWSHFRSYGTFSENPTRVPDDLGSVSQITASPRNTCAVTVSGIARCWGDNSMWQSGVPGEPGLISSVDVGVDGICVVTVSQQSHCWGVSSSYLIMNQPSKAIGITAVSVGSGHACAIKLDKTALCWGTSDYQKLKIPAITALKQISAGWYRTCALSESGAATCWGGSNFGSTEVSLSKLAHQISGNGGLCAVTADDRKSYCQAGKHFQVNGTVVVKQVETTGTSTCAIIFSGEIGCSLPSGSAITAVPQGAYTQISMTDYVACGLNTQGSVRCWGQVDAANVPNGSEKFTQISVDNDSSCGVTLDGAVKCWANSGNLSAKREVPLAFGQSLGTLLKVTEISPFQLEVNIQDEVAVGSTLIANVSQVAAATELTYQWCIDGNPIDQANSPVYHVVKSDIDKRVSVQVTGTLEGHLTATKTSNEVVVTPGELIKFAIPTILGKPRVDSLLTVDPGDWGDEVTFTYRWLRDGDPIGNGDTYTPRQEDLGSRLSVEVTGSSQGFFPKTKSSEELTVSVRYLGLAPVPIISGDVRVGESLSGIAGIWDEGVTLTYQWIRNGEPIVGANNSTYTPLGEDSSTYVSLEVTGSLPGIEPITKRSSSFKVGLGYIKKYAIPKISGDAIVGSFLQVLSGEWDTGVTLNYEWFRDGVPIKFGNKPTLKLSLSDVKRSISVKVTGSLSGYEYKGILSKSVVVAPTKMAPTKPKVIGRANVSGTLSAQSSPWVTGAKVRYQWLLNGKPIRGATNKTLKVLPTHRNQSVSVRVAQSRTGYLEASATSPSLKIK